MLCANSIEPSPQCVIDIYPLKEYNNSIMGHLEAQVGLIHGGGIRPIGDGFELRPGSVSRAERGIELYQTGVVERLVFSGGNANGHDFAQSEAGLMADIAVRADVPASAIEVESASTSTIGNWANSLPLIVNSGAEAVLGVTGRVATPRAEWLGVYIMSHYKLPVDIVGYRDSGEKEGLRAHPREAVSRAMAKRCLTSAEQSGVDMDQLDAFYLGWKSRTGLAQAKSRLTRR